MNNKEWKKHIKTLNNEELVKEVDKLLDWCDGYFGDLVEALVEEIKKRLTPKKEKEVDSDYPFY